MEREPTIIGCVYKCPNKNYMAGRGAVYSVNNIAPTVLTMSGGATIR